MKSTFVSLAFVAGLVAAQQGSIPTCAQPCVNAITSGGSIGGCKALDIKCICENGSLLDNLACCLEKNCDEAGKEAAVKYAAQICGSAGVKDIPTVVACKAEASKTGESGSKTESKTAGAAQETKSSDHSSGTSAHHTTATHTTADQASKTSGTSAQSTSTGEAMGLNAPVGMVGAAILGLLAL